MKNTLILICSIAFLFSCFKKEDNSNEAMVSISNKDTITADSNPYMKNYKNVTRMKKLLDDAIINGDTISYQDAYKNFIISDNSQQFLYYSIKMARRNNYSRAYFDTYSILNLLDKKNGFVSESDKNESLFYLLKAYEKGDINAKYKLDDLYTKKNTKIPSSSSLLIK
ncbi:hypothetical protein [Chryseobacterium wangxinyae]|uniref:hypothetical protein n=1 Tax=Chryseobacterium sp. CY353 TaxID=2997334 RepID=UPI00226EBAAC|nr:hypothetical protein [Chryseobacterium sp. CY353]MCY0968137.1 hypothetical protein [Chryseobacterium sp. CY353]